MIEQKSLVFTGVFVSLISVCFSLLNYFEIQYQFYVWEFFIDVKILFLILFVIFLLKRGMFVFSVENLKILQWSWAGNFLVFFIPLLVYLIIIAIGLLFKTVHLNDLDNKSTLVLATIFDIPAIFIFSTPSILIEELFFRSIIFGSFQREKSFWYSAIATSILWTIFNLTDIMGSGDGKFMNVASLMLYFFCGGIFCSALTSKYSSIWYAYSLRIGLITLMPLLLTSFTFDSDSFFVTETPFFNSEGILVAILLVVSSILIVRKPKIEIAGNPAT
ncbi:MAG: hypothetical protein PHP42_06290 [Bacteroidota bacterium]|nr:hypothetical protein [Bacteroidota bacterium]